MHFHSPCEKRLKQKRLHKFIRKFFKVLHFAVENSLVIRDGPLGVVGNVRLVCIQALRVVNLLIVDVHVNIEKKWVQYVVFKSNEKSWILFLLFPYIIRLCFFFVFCVCFSSIVGFVTTTLDEFQFQGQVDLSQFKVLVQLRLKFKLYAVFFKWGTRINFLFVCWQDIVNYCDFPSKFSRTYHKTLVPKRSRSDFWEMFVKMTLRDWLDFFLCLLDLYC